jgi:hypothetical protein
MIAKSCSLSLFAGLLVSLTSPAAEIRGVILKADVEKNQLTIERRGLGVRGLVMTFQLDKDTQIQIGRKPAKIADLSPGRRVRVVYELLGERHKALLITLVGGSLSPVSPPVAESGGNGVGGLLRRVSFTDREIVVISPASKAGEEIETTISVPEDVKIARDQRAIPFDDLKEGEQVLVQADKRDGKLVAKSIQLGVSANATPNAEPGHRNNIEQVRKALKLIDALLQIMEQKSRSDQSGSSLR